MWSPTKAATMNEMKTTTNVLDFDVSRWEWRDEYGVSNFNKLKNYYFIFYYVIFVNIFKK